MWTPAYPDRHRRFPSTWVGSAAFSRKLLEWGKKSWRNFRRQESMHKVKPPSFYFFLAIVTLTVSVQVGSGLIGDCLQYLRCAGSAVLGLSIKRRHLLVIRLSKVSHTKCSLPCIKLKFLHHTCGERSLEHLHPAQQTIFSCRLLKYNQHCLDMMESYRMTSTIHRK